jgi:chaperonin GroES
VFTTGQTSHRRRATLHTWKQGKAIAAGHGRYNDEGTRVPLDVKAGGLVLFGKFTGQEVTLDGEDYLVMREDDVLAVSDAGPAQ